MAPTVTVLHNPEAGIERYSKQSLGELFAAAGLQMHYVNLKEGDIGAALEHPGEAVVIGGGDGTVGRIAKQLIDRDILIGILPLGTANNIATSLGNWSNPNDLIARWSLERSVGFDVGVAHGPEGETLFLESIGFGLFPRLIRSREQDGGRPSREAELKDALAHQREIVSHYQSHHCVVTIDGERIEDDFLMVEIMNIPLAGPNMCLAREAQYGDGLLDVVLVAESDREHFAEYLTHRLRDREPIHQLFRRKAERVRVEWQGQHYHIDDQAHEAPPPVEVDVEVRRGALRFLAA